MRKNEERKSKEKGETASRRSERVKFGEMRDGKIKGKEVGELSRNELR